MKTGRRFLVVAVLALTIVLSMAAVASAQAGFPQVATYGTVQFAQNGVVASVQFKAEAVGAAMPGEDHQPAKGYLLYHDRTGLTYAVRIEHIHAHTATEVHFGGTIVRSTDPALVGDFAHMVAVDGGRTGDMFSVLVTKTGIHAHADPVPVLRGVLVVNIG